MPYICIYIYIINTRPCPNEKTNLLNISFINVPTIAFFPYILRSNAKR